MVGVLLPPFIFMASIRPFTYIYIYIYRYIYIYMAYRDLFQLWACFMSDATQGDIDLATNQPK